MARTRAAMVLAFVEAETVTGPAANLLDLQRTANRLQTSGAAPFRLEIVIATFARRSKGPEAARDLMSSAARAGVRVVQIPERFRLDPGIIALLRRTVAAIDPDLVQTHSVKSHAAVRLAGIQRERPWIAFHHGYTRPDLKMRLYNQADRWSLRGAHRVVTPARAFIAELVQRGVARDAIVVVPNAVDLDVARACDGERDAIRKWLGGPERVVLSIGRLSREKGHADLVRAVGLLKQRRPDLNVRLVIAGDGPERSSLASLSARAAPGSVQFLGHVRDAHRLHAVADVAVLPSHSEGSPNALLEAAAYACPIVATAVGDVADILTDQESGLIVPPRDAAALASAIEMLVVDRAAAGTYGESARRVVAARYQPADRARTLLNLYADLAVGPDVSSTPSPVCAF
jgi:glycosyltransferase involved in cell wall biosynthesis